MSDDFIGIDIAGLDEVKEKFGGIVSDAIDSGVESANVYVIDVLRTYPPRVEHGVGNPYQWQSEKQRRAFFATHGFGGGIPSRRTQSLRNGWETIGDGANQIIVNQQPHAPYVVGDKIQRGHIADGWKTVTETIKGRIGKIVSKFDSGVKKVLRKRAIG